MHTYTPYTYLIGWSKLDRWYYGSETKSRKGTAHPDNLWKTYFTSSRYVRAFRTEHGEPDVVTVHKIFKTKVEALSWETQVLRRLNAAKSPRWLNKTNGDGKFCSFVGKRSHKLSEETKEKLRQLNTGKVLSDETRRRIGLGSHSFSQKAHENSRLAKLGKHLSEEHKEAIRAKKTGSKHTPETLAKMRESQRRAWVTRRSRSQSSH
jgi:ribosomal protein L35